METEVTKGRFTIKPRPHIPDVHIVEDVRETKSALLRAHITHLTLQDMLDLRDALSVYTNRVY